VDSVKVGLFGGQCEGGLMWLAVLRWAYVGDSVKVGLCGGQCEVGLMCGAV